MGHTTEAKQLLASLSTEQVPRIMAALSRWLAMLILWWIKKEKASGTVRTAGAVVEHLTAALLIAGSIPARTKYLYDLH